MAKSRGISHFLAIVEAMGISPSELHAYACGAVKMQTVRATYYHGTIPQANTASALAAALRLAAKERALRGLPTISCEMLTVEAIWPSPTPLKERVA